MEVNNVTKELRFLVGDDRKNLYVLGFSKAPGGCISFKINNIFKYLEGVIKKYADINIGNKILKFSRLNIS